MHTIWLLVSWDEDMPGVEIFEDEHDAIERLKDIKPYASKANLYQIDPDGDAHRIGGW